MVAELSTCRLCQVAYDREQWVLDTGRWHIVQQFDTECCRNCRRAFWRGVAIAMGCWLSAAMIWWSLLVVGVVK